MMELYISGLKLFKLFFFFLNPVGVRSAMGSITILYNKSPLTEKAKQRE